MDRTRLKGIAEQDETPKRRIQNPDREPEAAVADRAAELTGGAILHLQRAAGNGAVTELLAQDLALQRQPADAPAPTQEKERSPAGWRTPWGSHEAKPPESGSEEKADVKKTPYTSPAVSTLHHLFDSQVVGNVEAAYFSLLYPENPLDRARDYLDEATRALDQLRRSYTNMDVKAELVAAQDLTIEARRMLAEHIEKQLTGVETIRQMLNPDEPPLLSRLTHLRDAIFKASDPVGSALHGQIDAMKALMHLFEHSVADNIRAAFTALEPPNPDFKRARAALVQADLALGGLKSDYAHDALLSTRVELVKDLVDSSQDHILEHLLKIRFPVADILPMIHPTDSELAKRLKVARAALG